MTSFHEEQQISTIAVDFDPFADGDVLLTAPATESQKEIWASVQMGRDANCAYNESQSLQVRGNLNLQALQKALQALVEQHESLRTTFSSDGVNLCITTAPKLDIPCFDFSECTEEERSSQVAKRLRHSVENSFNLEHGPLFRVEILKLYSKEHLIILTAHHIICDGWSWAVLVPDLGKLYSSLKQGNLLDLEESDRFSDYALTLEAEADSEETITAERFWLQQFADSVPVVDFPTDYPRPPIRTFRSARYDHHLSPILVTALKQLGAKSGCSFMTTLLSGFEVFLARLTGQSELVVGVSASGQAATGQYNLVGHCVNLLPLRTQVEPVQSFSDYLNARKSTVLDAYDHQQFTFGRLVQKLFLPRDSSRIPLVPIIFNVDQSLDSSKILFDGLEAKFFSNPRSFENFELFINATELAGNLTLECQYNTNLFNKDTIQRRMSEFETLLQGIVVNPKQLIARLPLLPSSEQQLLDEWNQTQVDYPKNLCLHQLVEAQVKRSPNDIAVWFEEQHLTYRDLDQRADQLAYYLRGKGVGAEAIVGVCVERSLEMVIGVLGILKAGGAYVPLDPAYPPERTAFMLEDCQADILLTQARLKPYLPEFAGQVICLDTDWQTIQAFNAIEELESVVDCPATPDNLAYIIYTSGSTGKPKGVQIQHSSVVNLLSAIQQQPGLTSQDTLLAVTTLSFDISVSEVFLPLIVGARLVIVSQEVSRDGLKLMHEMDRVHATFMQPTPATWRLLLSAGWQGNQSMKLISTGEALPRDLANQLLSQGAQLWNLYGPTEITIWATGCHVKAESETIPIGRPITNTQAYILDAHLQPLPIGVPGELHIGGAGIARGYLNRPELTAEKFIPDPFSQVSGARLYKTGDLARFLPDGQIECLGRIDFQVKLRGFRIELGEIEFELEQHQAVQQAVVTVREDVPGDHRLVAYVVPNTNHGVSNSKLQQFLKQKLPDYMLPSLWMSLDALPLTPNGKVDRKGLPTPDLSRPDLEALYAAPRNALEHQLADIWMQVLNLKRVGIHDNFFELGGYSLLATQILARVRQLFAIELSLLTLFEAPTVAELAGRLETLQWVIRGNQTSMLESVDRYEEGEL